jgi:nitrate reductase alpha subunit
MWEETHVPKKLSRRKFLWTTAAAGLATLAAEGLALRQLVPIVQNPLEHYPDRRWESVYRDQFRFDQKFTFLCAPNDTHNCLLTAYERNGIVVRIGPTYGYGQATDLYGFRASARWEPRCCQKGLALGRRFYGDRRIKGAMVRKGFHDWVKAGFPRDPQTGTPPTEYFNRGQDGWLKLGWDEAYELAAAAMLNIAKTYSGPEGANLLKAQNYDPVMIETMHEAGTQTLKVRGGMPFLGATRIFGLPRFANMLGLLDSHIRGVGPDKAVGARYWDSYSWHTDLPPGHPMVTGQQTVEFDLFSAEHAKLITIWGMNWICTKMPDGHWLTEARQRGSKIITIASEYQSTSNKADEVMIIRPGTDGALALGLAHVIINEKTYDADYVKTFTDLPLLVRMDTLQLVRASDVIKNYQLAELSNYAKVLQPDEKADPNAKQPLQYISAKARGEWGDFLVWDSAKNAAAPVTRDQVGKFFSDRRIEPALEGAFTFKTVDGKEIKVRPVFDLVREYLKPFTPENVSRITWAPADAIVSLARQIAENKASTLLPNGMGPNHFFNADLKDRAIFLVAALTRNIGYLGGSPGSYAGNYRVALFNGLPQFILEDPFNIELDPSKPAKTKTVMKAESAHYYNYGDRPLRVGNKLFTGKTHLPTPTKLLWFCNSNSLLGNAKWAYDVIHNTLPKIEAVIVNDWWWTMSCEYSDVVFGVDSWAELKYPDMCGSVTNPFVQIYPRTPLPRIFDTQSDVETYARVASKLAEMTKDARFIDYWHFVHAHRLDVYLQRICDASSSLKGYRFSDLEEQAQQGTPTLKLLRTYPKVVGWEQTQESKPWYTKTGRLEFYREEPEFIEYGENLPVYREPVDATFHEPNVIVGTAKQESLKPTPPEGYGLKSEDLSTETRQVRNKILSPEEVVQSKHPREKDGLRFLCITPKYRHGAHTTPVDLDVMATYFGPFGDIYRRDKRTPWTGEAYADINPHDAKELSIEDGDYIWVDADPEDRPYRGAKPDDPDYKIARLMCRARYYSGTPRGVVRMWFNMYQATHGTVKAHETRPDKLAKNSETNYQAIFRYGGHQSTTRAWLRPTLMTDSLVRKDVFGQQIGQGFASDVHCPVGAPKESFVRITKAEPGGADEKSLWRPAALGFRPTYENDEMKKYLQGGFISADK